MSTSPVGLSLLGLTSIDQTSGNHIRHGTGTGTDDSNRWRIPYPSSQTLASIC